MSPAEHSNRTFIIDAAASDYEYLVVEVDGIATVIIKREAEGIIADIRPICGTEAVASAFAFDAELLGRD
ncbi:MAG: hypothetical protein AB7E81_04485 [Hyphomicrobiaceae bacterium]|jgi:hypothetical protein